MYYSPLRYPGGKNKLAKYVGVICDENNIHKHYIEPYAGGASVALYLLFNNHIEEITINDIDRSIYAFWYSVLNHTDKLCSKIEETEVNVTNWKEQKEVQRNKEEARIFDLGFSTFFLNRTNVSGVINGGIIGGVNQTGKYKIDCRSNKKDLILRIRKIADRKDKIHLYNMDAVKLISELRGITDSRSLFYFDPPYYMKGKSLYINHYKHEDHETVSESIKKIVDSSWIVSYDDTPEIKNLYQLCRKKEYSFFHTAHRAKKGKEVLFFSDDLIVPQVVNPVSFSETVAK